MMTLHKLHASDGYTYLTRQVAAGDEGRSAGQKLVDYYTASGNPPGRWLGTGAADLSVIGRVREDQMRALFGKGMHPDAEQIIALETAAGRSTTEATRAAKLGRAFPNYTPLPPRSERIAQRLQDFQTEHDRTPTATERARIEGEEARRDRRAVAGYDLVFTPVKSASLLWALGSAHVREQVESAHHDAVADTLAWLERETAFARVGDKGQAQIETRGFLAAAFDHRDSRAGDPDLHTHLAISNKVRAREDRPDGQPRWLSLDARTLHAAAVAASERYNTRFEDALTRRLGVQFAERPDTVRRDKRPVREIAGVSDVLIRHFSRRRAAIEDRYRELTGDYRTAHGHEPPREAQLKLAQQATLETRDAKAAASSLAGKITGWREEATTVIGHQSLRDLEATVTGHHIALTSPAELPLEDLAGVVRTAVSEEKATWTRWNLLAETERRLRGYRFPTPADRDAATQAVLTHAIETSVALTPPDHAPAVAADLDVPGQLRRSNGESVFAEHGADRYTSQDLLDAEQRLLDFARQPTRYGIAPHAVTDLIDTFERRYDLTLDDGQRALVLGFAGDPRRLIVGVGPAGAGKTTAMRALAYAWRTSGRRVVPLGPSAASAKVLADELGCRAENLHKFQHMHTTGELDDDWYRLQPGDLVLVDEAGMAGTRRLDWLTRYARERGALVRLLGDHAQMSAVEAGGAFRLLTHDVGAIELDQLHRFTDPREATATLQLRDGNTQALDFYFTHDRVRSGTDAAMLEKSYKAWADDTRHGRASLLVATSSQDVIALNARARLERVHLGEVTSSGVPLHDGNTAGVGDRVATRANNRRLATRGGMDFVKNGDQWTVTRHHHNGDLTIRHQEHDGTVRLPAEYVADSLELGYATTTTRAQGLTVDTAHVLVDSTTTREALYVAATRGRDGAHLYLANEELLGIDAERPPTPETSARDFLNEVLQRQSAELAATEVMRHEAEQAVRRQRAAEDYVSQTVLTHRYTRTITRALGNSLGRRVLDDPALPSLALALHRVETRGGDPAEALRRAAARHELDSAASLARVLSHRLGLTSWPSRPPAEFRSPTASPGRKTGGPRAPRLDA